MRCLQQYLRDLPFLQLRHWCQALQHLEEEVVVVLEQCLQYLSLLPDFLCKALRLLHHHLRLSRPHLRWLWSHPSRPL